MNGYRKLYKIALGWDIVMKPAVIYKEDTKIYEGNWVEFDEDNKANKLSGIPTHPAIYPVLKGTHFISGGEEYKVPDSITSGVITTILGEHIAETSLFVAEPTNTWETAGLPVFLKYDATPDDEHKRWLMTTDPQGEAETVNIVIGYLHKPLKVGDTTIKVRITVPCCTVATPAE
jgi:hypothetical protein